MTGSMSSTIEPPRARTATARAIGVIRVSQVNGREGESFASPDEQRQRIEQTCEREGLTLLEAHEELDTSGGSPLARRSGLRAAVEAVERGEADVIVVAYFDRLVRSLTVQAEVLARVERAGGRVLAADVGEVGHDTAARWLSATMLGMVAEYARRTTAERSAAAQRRAVEQGRPPIILPPGLHRVGDRVEIDPKHADTVREAVRMRASGATIAKVRDHLRAHGIERSYHGTTTLLKNRLLIGEIVFGDLRGEVPALIDRETWERAQRMSVPRGRKPKSDRLLARLGVLRCGNCGARMVVGTQKQNGRSYPFYRCPPTGDCTSRVTIGAEIVEGLVVERVKHLAAGITGTASMDDKVREAAQALDAAQAELDTVVRALTAAGLDGEGAAAERLAELRQARDDAREHHEQLAAHQAATSRAVTVGDWDELTTDERRDLIAAVIERVEIGSAGRGAERLTIIDRAE